MTKAGRRRFVREKGRRFSTEGIKPMKELSLGDKTIQGGK